MRKVLALAIAASSIFGTGLSLANHEPGEEDATIPLSSADPTQGDLYVDLEGPGLWQESNECPGLQTGPVDCDHDEETPPDPADTDVLASVPAPPDAPTPPDVPLP